MGDFVQKVFGGGKSSSKPKDTTPEELKALRQPFVDNLTALLSSGGRPAYEGPLVAGITGAEQNALGAVNAAATDPSRQQLLQQTLQGYFLPGQQGANPFLQSAIQAAQRPTQLTLNDTLARNLPGVFTAAGQTIGGGLRSPNQNLNAGSTAFDMAAARAFEGGSNALSDIATNMSFQGYESERGRQQQAIQLQQQDVDTLVKNLQAQGLPRLIEDLGIERGLAEFQSRMNSLLQALQIAGGAPIAQQGQVQSQTNYGGIVPALFPKGLGGGSSGATR